MVNLLECELQRAKNAYEAGDTATAVENALWWICSNFESTTDIDISWFQEEVSNMAWMKIGTEEKKWEIGYMVAILVFYGSSKNQAMDAISDWLLLSKTKVRDAYYHIEQNDIYREHLETGWDYKLCSFHLLICHHEVERLFPKQHKKAYLAYLKAGLKYFEGDVALNNGEEIFLKLADFKTLEAVEKKLGNLTLP